jgi:DNA repair protein RadC
MKARRLNDADASCAPDALDALRTLFGLAGSSDGAQAEALLKQYGSLAPILESNAEDLAAIPGVSATAAQLIGMMPQLTRYLEANRLGDHPCIATFSAAKAYLTPQFIGRYYEHCYELCLGGDGRLIECALVQQGTVDETPFYIRLLLERAIRTGAHAVVLSHNHPSGTENISPADAMSTKSAIRAFEHIGVLVLDHVIICDKRAVSIRFADEEIGALIERQAPTHPLIRDWFRPRPA